MGELSTKIKGRVKQGLGGLTGDKALQKEGEDDVRAGHVEGGGRGREARRDRGGERRQTRVQRDFKVGGHVHDSLSIVAGRRP